MKSVAFTLAVLLATLTVVKAAEQTPEQKKPVETTQSSDKPLDVSSTNSSSDVPPITEEQGQGAPAQ